MASCTRRSVSPLSRARSGPSMWPAPMGTPPWATDWRSATSSYPEVSRSWRRARYLIRFLQWLAATRYSQVENFASPRNWSIDLKTVTKTSWARSSASSLLPIMRKRRLKIWFWYWSTISRKAPSSRSRKRRRNSRSRRDTPYFTLVWGQEDAQADLHQRLVAVGHLEARPRVEGHSRRDVAQAAGDEGAAGQLVVDVAAAEGKALLPPLRGDEVLDAPPEARVVGLEVPARVTRE